jgi:hypothetical protein
MSRFRLPSRLALLAALTAGLALVSGSRTSRADDESKREKIKALIIDGQNNHDWKRTSPVLKAALESCGLFDVDIVTARPGERASNASSPLSPSMV